MGRSQGNARTIFLLIGRASALLLLVGFTLAGQRALAVEEPDEQAEENAGSQNEAPGVDQRVLGQARDLLNKRQSGQAYELLAPHEYDWAGDPEYDYLLGTAAVASGRADEAVMPLERAVGSNPDNAAARRELARAYYGSGEPELARTEMDHLGLQQLPPSEYGDVYRDIDRTATAAARASGPRERNFRYYVQLDSGYDSNANAGTSQSNFLGFALNNRNVKTSSAYSAISNGGIWYVPLSANWTYDFRFNLVQRRNFSATFANTDRAGLSNRFVMRKGVTDMDFGVGLYTAYLDSRFPYDGDYSQSGLNLDYGVGWRVARSLRLGLGVAAAAIRHRNSIKVFDINQYFHDVNLTYIGEGPKPTLGVALIIGDAQATHSGSPYGRDQYGARFTGSWRTGSKGRMYSHLSAMKSNYDGNFFGERRHDTYYSTGLSAVLNVFPSRNWSLVPHLAYIRNQSDVSLFEYSRTEIGLAVRWLSD